MISERSFELYCPTKVKFGVGISSKAGEELKNLKARKIMVVVDSGIVGAGLLDDILLSLKKADLPYVVFDEVEVNATLSKVLKASEIQKEKIVIFFYVSVGEAP